MIYCSTLCVNVPVSVPAARTANGIGPSRHLDCHVLAVCVTGEYIQMSGRAGRRNRDTSGTVIIMAVPSCPDRAKLCALVCSESIGRGGAAGGTGTVRLVVPCSWDWLCHVWLPASVLV